MSRPSKDKYQIECELFTASTIITRNRLIIHHIETAAERISEKPGYTNVFR